MIGASRKIKIYIFVYIIGKFVLTNGKFEMKIDKMGDTPNRKMFAYIDGIPVLYRFYIF